MRVVFLGTPEFAVPSLEALAAHHQVVAVYTQPDRPKGRGNQLAESPVKVGRAGARHRRTSAGAHPPAGKSGVAQKLGGRHYGGGWLWPNHSAEHH